MPHEATAWFLYPGGGRDVGRLADLRQERIELRSIEPSEILAAPLFGCWEGNMNHALLRKPVDICRQRKEDRVILGNSGVVRVLEVGSDVDRFQPGDLAMIFCASVVDQWGYPELAMAYDAPNTMGCLTTRMIVRPHELLQLPRPTRHSLPQWAAFSARYVTAWSNWVQAYGTFRLMVPEEEMAHPNVWGWGGGTTLAELDLARRHGARSVMMSGDRRRLELIEATGVEALDRNPWRALAYDEHLFVKDKEYRRVYLAAESEFLGQVAKRTDGNGVQIFIEYIGTPVLRATLKALSRNGVIATAGWQQGMAVTFLRATECIARHQHVHTHFARYAQGIAAMKFGEAEGWMPTVDEHICDFDEIPTLARRFHRGDVGFYPVYSVRPE